MLVLHLFIIFLLCVVFHEAGHIIYFSSIGRDVKIKFFYKSLRRFGVQVGTLKDYAGLTNKQYIRMNLAGILAGLIPIIYYSLNVHEFFLLMILPYFAGCIKDFKNMENARK